MACPVDVEMGEGGYGNLVTSPGSPEEGSLPDPYKGTLDLAKGGSPTRAPSVGAREDAPEKPQWGISWR